MTTQKHPTETKASEVVLRVRSIARRKRPLIWTKDWTRTLWPDSESTRGRDKHKHCLVECEPLCSMKTVTQFYMNFYLPCKRKMRF